MSTIVDSYKIDPETLYTMNQVAYLLRCKRYSVNLLIKRGELKARKIGTQWRIYGQAIKDFILREFV